MQRFVRANIKPRSRRRRRVRTRVIGTAARPRLSVFRSTQHVTVQLIDDAAGVTIVAATDREVGDVATGTNRRTAAARAVGALLAERARVKGITAVVFDRGGYAYHGRVQAIAEGAREGGLEF
ncbi:50S ribosomal protein L18 [Candidatus Uhrbacteria bacterium]|nr:50S ribosomal protein L18 [Candidatus Uhrbacteria bacterium]